MDGASTPLLPDLAAIRAAHARIAPHVHRTPVLTCAALDEETGAHLYFKCENFQKVGAFKARGATQRGVLARRRRRCARGVVTHSSGNHGAALAFAAARRGIPAWVVMPENAPQVKLANVRRYGATVRLCVPTLAAREAACAELLAATGATLVHPFDDATVIAGQGTAALELLDAGAGARRDRRAGRRRRTPVGHRHRCEVDATWHRRASAPSRRTPTTRREALPRGAWSRAAAATTIADGLRTTLSPRTLAALRAHVAAIGTCDRGGASSARCG